MIHIDPVVHLCCHSLIYLTRILSPSHMWDFWLQEKPLWKSSSWASSFSQLLQVKSNIKQQQGLFFFLVESHRLSNWSSCSKSQGYILFQQSLRKAFQLVQKENKKKREKKNPNTSPKSQIFKMLSNLNSERLFQAKAVRLRIYKPNCSTLVAKQNCPPFPSQ